MNRLALQDCKFEKWKVISFIECSRPAKWLCRCECGREKEVNQGNLVRGRTKSCGCHRIECLSVLRSTHGGSKGKLYGIWSAMRRRCNLKTSKDYPNYGARGIKVCNEWAASFATFQEWSLKNGYKELVEIDRIDNDGNYEPLNCQYVSKFINAKNKRNNRQITINGVTKPLTQWAEEVGISKKTVHSRIGYGWSENDLFKPLEVKK